MEDNAGNKKRDVIAELTSFLRDHGEQILSGQRKLSLTAISLCMLNEGFSHISDGDFNQSFEVIPTNRTCIPIYQDLQFLYDFVQKVLALKVIHGSCTLQGSVSVANFRSLQSLDIRKVPLHLVTGIQKLRFQLQTIICTRCLHHIHDLLESCGGDQSSPMSWPALTTASVAYNSLQELDTSLRLLPALKMLDLSHNKIRTTERHLEYLTELRWISLAFNSLEKMPSFSFSVRNKLDTLILRNNCLDNLRGLDELVNLRELDVCSNCLDSHSVLEPLRPLHKLQKLLLIGNPVQYVKDHRKRSVACVSPVAAKKLILDGKPVTAKELKHCKVSQPMGRPIYISQATSSQLSSSVNADPHDITVESITVDETDSAPLLPSAGNAAGVADAKSKIKGKKKIKSRKARTVDLDESGSFVESMEGSSIANSYASSKGEHLHIKEQHEKARSHLGADWLQTLSSDNWQSDTSDARQVDRGDAEQPGTSSRQHQTADIGPDGSDAKPQSEREVKDVRSSKKDDQGKPNNEVLHMTKNEPVSTTKASSDTQSHGKTNLSTTENYATKKSVPAEAVSHWPEKQEAPAALTNGGSRTEKHSSVSQNSPGASHDHDPGLVKPLLMKTESQMVDSMWKRMDQMESSIIEDFGPESDPFIVFPEGQEESPYLITISEQYLLEKDLSGNLCEKLELSCLKDIEKITRKDGEHNGPVVRLQFRYMKKDRRERVLVMEDDDCMEQFVSFLEPRLEKNRKDAKYKDQMQCLKCGCKFNKKNANRVLKDSSSIASNLSSLGQQSTPTNEKATLELTLACAKCNSVLLIELDSDKQNKKKGKVPSPLKEAVTPVFGSPLATSSAFTTPQKRIVEGNSKQRDSDSFQSVSEPSGSFRSIGEGSAGSVKSPDTSYSNYQSPKSHKTDSGSPSTGTGTFTSAFLETSKASVQGTAKSMEELSVSQDEMVCNKSTGSVQSLTSTQLTKRSSGGSQDSDILVLQKHAVSEVEQRSTANIVTQKSVDSDITVISKESDISILSQDPFKPHLDDLPETSPCGSLGRSTLTSMVESMYENSLSAKNSSSSLVIKQESSIDVIAKSSENNKPKVGSPAGIIIQENYFKAAVSSSPEFQRLSPEGAAHPLPHSETSSFKSAESGGLNVQPEKPPDVTGVTRQLQLPTDNLVKDRNKIEYDYSDFSLIDHRLKLHLTMNVFYDYEEFSLLLRCQMVKFLKADETEVLLVLTNLRALIFTISGTESTENIGRWLKLSHKENLTDLQYVDISIGYQGFRLEFGKEENCFKFLLRDESICKRFISQLTGLVQGTAFSAKSKLQGIMKNNPEVIEHLNQQVLGVQESSKDETSMTLLKFVMCFLNIGKLDSAGYTSLLPVSLVVTSSHICLAEENHQWPRPRCLPSNTVMKGQHFTLRDRQRINNIASIELYEDHPRELKVEFFDEAESKERSWHITMTTEDELLALLTAVRQPWESEFGVEMQVNTVQMDM